MKKFAILIPLVAMYSTSGWAATQSATLSVAGMTCAACPITVRKALSNVDGVNSVIVNFEKREAIVTFDDTRTNTAALTRATANAGYPSRVEGASSKENP